MAKVTALARKARKLKAKGVTKIDKNKIIVTYDETEHRKGALTLILAKPDASSNLPEVT